MTTTSDSDRREFWTRLSKQLADDGKLIEAGWLSLRLLMRPDAPQVQIDEMRMAYMAGAQHLFSSMMSIMDSGEEPTEADLNRMSLIHTELENFQKEWELWAAKTKGSA
jgi:hypothetical protein